MIIYSVQNDNDYYDKLRMNKKQLWKFKLNM